MKKVENATLSEEFGKEVETIVLTQGKPYRHVIGNGKLWFTIYEVQLNGLRMFALVAHKTAFKAFGAKEKGSGLICFCHDKDVIIRELAEILVSLEDNGLLAA
jgi:hypothetical protein